MFERASDTVKVTDFGIARITDSSKTKTGLVLGTPSFMSPEQLAGKRVDGRSDLYSLGVMLYQLLAGVLPFRGDSMAELMYKIANEPVPDVRKVRSDLPVALTVILAKALTKTPDDRYQDGAAFAADLRELLASLGDAPQTPSPVSDKTASVARPDFEATVPAMPSDFAKTVPAAQAYDKTVAQRAAPSGASDIEI
jgi:serine/threonine-protein kinase